MIVIHCRSLIQPKYTDTHRSLKCWVELRWGLGRPLIINSILAGGPIYSYPQTIYPVTGTVSAQAYGFLCPYQDSDIRRL